MQLHLATLLIAGICLLKHVDAKRRDDEAEYLIGAGIADVTGPAAGVGMLGYANPSQISSGIHIRQYSRAFVIDDLTTSVVFVSVDCAMMGQLVKNEVIRRLQESYKAKYTHENVVLSSTHTHSGVAGFMQYVLFGITNLGFVKQSFDAMVEGIVLSISRAHKTARAGSIYWSEGELLHANINRSPTAYMQNPEEERAKYQHDVDKNMFLLKMVTRTGEDIGIINWFAVHPTNMKNTNTLISGDNKGYASQRFEEKVNHNLPGKGDFIAAFASTNLGDASPNIRGAHCQDTGLPCDLHTSTCNGQVQLCVSTGPGRDQFESTEIIGKRQFEKAWELFKKPDANKISGPIFFIHQYVNMTNYEVDVMDPLRGPTKANTCKPAMGYSFAAGTIDGPGAFDFTQGMTETNPFWNIISHAIKTPTEEQIACHAPKPILLDTGEMSFPYTWQPAITDTQIVKIGNVAIVAVPGEFTTMAGRRLREAVGDTLRGNGAPEDVQVVIAGLSNSYTDYITTYEEYQVQRYEGASTIYGPHTLQAYLQQYSKLAAALMNGEHVEPGPEPPNLYSSQLSFVPGVIFDHPPNGHSFGDCVLEPYKLVYTGDTVIARFISGHPRNNLMREKTFLTVEMQISDKEWSVVATDASWETKFHWDRISTLLGESEVEIKWEIPAHTKPGYYRIHHFGYHKQFMSPSKYYEGTSRVFQVKARPWHTVDYYKRHPKFGRRAHENWTH